MTRREDDEQRAYPGESTTVLQPQAWVGGWVSPITVTLFTLIWCFAIYLLIGDRPRTWQYGTVPYVPGQSLISSALQSSAGPTPRQVELPE